jgi:hypothetical protein
MCPDVFAGKWSDDVDVSRGVDECLNASSCYRTAADYNNPALGKVKQERVSIHTCSPHSDFSRPAQRPARALSPGRTGRVQGAQPIEANPI